MFLWLTEMLYLCVIFKTDRNSDWPNQIKFVSVKKKKKKKFSATFVKINFSITTMKFFFLKYLYIFEHLLQKQ